MYVVRYEDIKFGVACDILRKNGGYFDADSRSLIVLSEDLNANTTRSESEVIRIISEVREESKELGYREGKWAGDLGGFKRGYKKGLDDM